METRPARLADIAEVRPRLVPRHLGALTMQMQHSSAVSFLEEGRAVAVVGLYPHGDHFEAWLALAPEISKATATRVLRQMARLRMALPEGMKVIAHVRRGHRPGFRIAAMLGFLPSPADEGGDDVALSLDLPSRGLG